MKFSPVTFARLRRFLIDLGFQEVELKTARRFEHAPSNTIFLFRAYQPRDKVTMPDLIGIKTQLDWRGMLPADAFDDSLEKSPA
jgi:hypothetical protein